MVVPAAALFATFGFPADTTDASLFHPTDHGDLRNMHQLAATFAHNFAAGAASERTMSNAALFAAITGAAKSIPADMSVGGNAALMAAHFARNANHRVRLVSAAGPELKALLPPGVEMAPGASNVSHDEFHLILEYAKGEQVTIGRGVFTWRG
jgi:hypothetical protein